MQAASRASFRACNSEGWEIRERLGISANRYHQLLNALLDDPRALVHNPMLINRLRRRREFLRAARASRRAS